MARRTRDNPDAVPVIDRVQTVLGDWRPVTRVYGDGSVDCPYCSSPIMYPQAQCQNPWCDANPAWSAEKLTEHRLKRETEQKQRLEEEERRRSISEFHRQSRIEHEQWASEQVLEAKRRGTCLNCLFQSGWERAKFIRHRGQCPRAR